MSEEKCFHGLDPLFCRYCKWQRWWNSLTEAEREKITHQTDIRKWDKIRIIGDKPE